MTGPGPFMSSKLDNNDVGENLFEDEQAADSAKWIAAMLAGTADTLERCGARARQQPSFPSHHTRGAAIPGSVGLTSDDLAVMRRLEGRVRASVVPECLRA
jgi:hypothetical protein